ncbi:MAG: adenosylmethionine--8-amino-7-oxononanoate transaminase [Rhodobacterales bacterium]|nr:adenosylmethionine--8-amino-7-oxononanoate transaminase [Rhodobacterales bacterium]
MATLTELDHRHLWHPFTQQRDWMRNKPLIIERAEGNYLIDVQGNRYLDAVSSLWTNVHGHRVPEIDQAIRDQLDKVAHSTLLGLSHPPAILLATRLVELAPDGLQRVFFSDNGSTSTEVALKMAFQYQQQIGQTKRTQFASLRDAYHGDTIGAVSVGSIDLFHQVYRPLLFEGLALPAPVQSGGEEEAACLERALTLLEAQADTLACLIVEPLVQGAAGMKMHSPYFLKTLLERARALGVLVAVDEVATGFGRTGTLFAVEQADFTPDFMCMAKGIAGGYLPLAATLTTEKVYEAFLAEPEAYKQFFHGHTFTGNPLACAAAMASLDLFDRNNSLAHASDIADEFTQGLHQVAALDSVRAVRQTGLMIGIDLAGPDGAPPAPGAYAGHAVAMAARPLGAILRPLGNTVVINPPLSFTLDQVDALIDITTRAIKQV